MPADLDLVRRLAAADRGLAVVSTARPDGSVQSSLVNAGVFDHPVTKEPTVAFVARGSAYKLRLFAAAGRANVVFRSGWQWVSVEGPVDIIGPGHARSGFPEDGYPQLLRDIFTAAGGTHDNWAEYDRVMAEERRTAVFVTPERITTN
ncbi:MAG TPA: pyridoxamine 5'-phosphate oxidase family protein [Acidimicrobiia bacterium]|nr:pyridoxamine 5'-phosphate oxidase family protein [Acidimicrobiia bacterium]